MTKQAALVLWSAQARLRNAGTSFSTPKSIRLHLLSTLTGAISGLENVRRDDDKSDKHDDWQKNSEKQAQYQSALEAQAGYFHHE